MTNTKAPISRADSIRKRRAENVGARASTASQHVRRPAPSATPVVSRVATTRQATVSRTSTKSRARRRYNIALPMGFSRQVSVPQFGVHMTARWASGMITAIMAALLLLMWNMDPFIIRTARVSGNQRLAVADINSVLGVLGQSIVVATPEQLEYNLRTAFPELKSVSVSVGFPSTIAVNVIERTPLVAWQQDDKVSWIDAEGIAFQPRGTVEGLIPVLALGTPPSLAGVTSESLPESALIPTAQQMLLPETVRALQALVAYVPEGTVLIYDPNYGLGWDDPRGWKAYFGSTGGDMALKVQMYQAIVDNLTQRGVAPSIISVENPNAPFYRIAGQ